MKLRNHIKEINKLYNAKSDRTPLTIINVIPMIAAADVGPKPSLEIIVQGMDNDNYWLDLQVTYESRYSWLE